MFAVGSYGAAHAQDVTKTSTQDSPIETLVKEVRLLRTALERNNRYGVLLQLTVDRVRLQQQRVDQLSQRLENVQNELTIWTLNQPPLNEQLKQIEEQLESESDPSQIEKLKSDYRQTQGMLGQQTRRRQQLEEQESQLKNDLQMEQQKLETVNERLIKLETDIENETAPKPQ